MVCVDGFLTRRSVALRLPGRPRGRLLRRMEGPLAPVLRSTNASRRHAYTALNSAFLLALRPQEHAGEAHPHRVATSRRRAPLRTRASDCFWRKGAEAAVVVSHIGSRVPTT